MCVRCELFVLLLAWLRVSSTATMEGAKWPPTRENRVAYDTERAEHDGTNKIQHKHTNTPSRNGGYEFIHRQRHYIVVAKGNLVCDSTEMCCGCRAHCVCIFECVSLCQSVRLIDEHQITMHQIPMEIHLVFALETQCQFDQPATSVCSLWLSDEFNYRA